MTAASARRADIAFFASLAVSAILLVLFGFTQLRIDKLGSDDFSTAWAGARALLLGADPYDVATWTDTVLRITPRPLLDTAVYAYPPWVALALLPLGALPVELAGIVWSAATISLALIAVRALLRAYVPSRPWAHALVGALALVSAPAVVALLLGQWPFLFVAMLARDRASATRRPAGRRRPGRRPDAREAAALRLQRGSARGTSSVSRQRHGGPALQSSPPRQRGSPRSRSHGSSRAGGPHI